MPFIVKNTTGATRHIGDLSNLALVSLEEYDLDVKFGDDEIGESADLVALLDSGVLQKLTTFGGVGVPASEAFHNVSLELHEDIEFPHHPHANLGELATITDGGGGVIPSTQQLTKLDLVEDGATADQSALEILARLVGLAQQLAFDVQLLEGNSSADLLARANHTGTQLATTVSDFSAAADARVNSQKGVAAGGLATLDGNGQLTPTQIPSSLASGLTPQGNWNASANTPDLAALSPANGDFYIVNVSGATLLGGVSDWQVGDWAIYFTSGGWTKVDHSDSVATVNGQSGTVVLNTDDVSEGTSKYYADALVALAPSVAANTTKVSADGLLNTHSDVSALAGAEGEFLRRQAGVWAPHTLAEIPVRGLEREEFTSPGVDTTRNTWLTKLDVQVNVIAGHRYRFDLDYHWNANNTGRDLNSRTLLDGLVVDEHRQEPKDSSGSFGSTGSDQRHSYAKKFFFTATTTGTVQLLFEFRYTANYDASVWDLIVEKYRVE